MPKLFGPLYQLEQVAELHIGYGKSFVAQKWKLQAL